MGLPILHAAGEQTVRNPDGIGPGPSVATSSASCIRLARYAAPRPAEVRDPLGSFPEAAEAVEVEMDLAMERLVIAFAQVRKVPFRGGCLQQGRKGKSVLSCNAGRGGNPKPSRESKQFRDAGGAGDADSHGKLNAP